MEENKGSSNHTVLLIETIEAGYGSAFFVCKNLIVTNIHVIAAATSICAKSIDTQGNTIKKFTVEGIANFDGKNDLAVLKVEDEGTPFLLSDNEVQTDERILVIGYPCKKYKVTKGTVHGVCNGDKWLQMKVKTAKGNSGGPVLNSKGQIIGIHSHGNGSDGYAISSNALTDLLLNLRPAVPIDQWNKQEVSRAYVYYLRGEEKYRAGHYEEATTYLDKAIHLCPNCDVFHGYRARAKTYLGESEVQRGNIAEAQKLYKEAIDDYTRIIQIYPKSTQTYVDRGVIKCLLGQTEDREKNVVEAQEHYQDAIADYTEAINLCPDYALAYNNRADAKCHFGKSEDAAGNVEAAQDLYQKAMIDINTAIELASGVPLFYHTLGEIMYALGDYSAAIENYETARKIDPDYTDVCKDLELAKEVLEQQEKAQSKG